MLNSQHQTFSLFCLCSSSHHLKCPMTNCLHLFRQPLGCLNHFADAAPCPAPFSSIAADPVSQQRQWQQEIIDSVSVAISFPPLLHHLFSCSLRQALEECSMASQEHGCAKYHTPCVSTGHTTRARSCLGLGRTLLPGSWLWPVAWVCSCPLLTHFPFLIVHGGFS